MATAVTNKLMFKAVVLELSFIDRLPAETN